MTEPTPATTESVLRGFRRPLLWLAMWASMIVGVIVLSLVRGPPIPAVLVIGKFDHFIAYFALQAVAVQLYATRRAQMGAALAMVALGIGMELAQGYLTTYRDMSAYDAFIDTVGVAIGFAIAWTPLDTLLLRIDLRLMR
ncbi:MAG TPA: VanZ family protein [Xanthomonadaceae bacterium]|jgi:VanZ family protein|nr:VanZ family protein [Xanthomonadaceae bacterium]